MESSFDVELMFIGEDGFGETRLGSGDGEGDETIWSKKERGRQRQLSKLKEREETYPASTDSRQRL